ncbi:hypothetical protein BSPWISOXPB_590 [uncultured Gammaproteobacteria bacterium]|nr:hypothetical protein BSPWISOXPB_590 [uncultured Gammaproteobacteria bacterium]
MHENLDVYFDIDEKGETNRYRNTNIVKKGDATLLS